MSKILFIGAHNDECEYGTGGIAALLSHAGHEVMFLNVACKRHSVRTPERLKVEEEMERRAAEILGAKKKIVGDRSSSAYFQTPENTEIIMNEIIAFKPDIVFMHWPKDNHIEHREVSRATLDALCLAAVRCVIPSETYAFEAGPDQTMQYFQPDIYIDITEAAPLVEKSLKTFDMEHANGEELWREKEVCARFRGHLAGVKYAETLKIIKFPTGFEENELLLPKLLKGKFSWHNVGMYPWGRQYFL